MSGLRTTPLAALAVLVVAGSLLSSGVAAAQPLARTAASTVASVASTVPPTPPGLPTAIEPLAAYVGQTSCDPHIRPGTAKLARLLAATYPVSNWASTYACGTDGSQSEHYDGRAIDWMVSIRNAHQYTSAKAFLAWLLAKDRAGNSFAMARRLGVMYVIYDNRMWGAWDGRWEPYNNCSHLPGSANDNACHRTHMHISLGWNGAMGRTSYWTKRLSPTDFGPCRPRDLNWAPRYSAANPVPCPGYPKVSAPRGASAAKQSLVTWSGAALGRGSSGPGVSAVQRAMHVAASGSYGSATVAAVRSFQSRHRLMTTGGMTISTWRALLASVR